MLKETAINNMEEILTMGKKQQHFNILSLWDRVAPCQIRMHPGKLQQVSASRKTMGTLPWKGACLVIYLSFKRVTHWTSTLILPSQDRLANSLRIRTSYNETIWPSETEPLSVGFVTFLPTQILFVNNLGARLQAMIINGNATFYQYCWFW